MDKQGLRLILLTQIFSVMLVIKSLATNYFSTYYGLHGYEELILEHGNTLNQIAIFLIIPITLVSLTILFNWSEKTKRYLEIASVVSMLIVTLISLFLNPILVFLK